MSHDIYALDLYVSPNERGINSVQLLLALRAPGYMRLVENAITTILLACHPHSVSYAEPRQRAKGGDEGHAVSFSGTANHVNMLMGPYAGNHGLNGQSVYLDLMVQLDLLLTYVQYRGTNGTNNWMVGEEWFHVQAAYKAIFAFQYWKVECLEVSVARDGTEFGSATGWNTTCYLKYVENWPTLFADKGLNFDLPFERPVLPKDRDDWQDRRKAYKVQRARRKLEEASSPITVSVRTDDDFPFNEDATLTVWSINDDSIHVHDKGQDFNAEVHVTHEVPLLNIRSINGVSVIF